MGLKEKGYLLIIPLISLIALPISIDPYNWPKQIVLIITTFIGLTLLGQSRIPIWALTSISILTFLIIIDPNPLIKTLWGSSGRQDGLITYSCFILIAVVISKLNYLKKYPKSFLIVLSINGLLESLYTCLQLLNRDPLKLSGRKLLVGLVGNADFLSANIALGIIALLALIYLNRESLFRIPALTILLLPSIFIIWKIKVVQGYMIIFIAFLVFFYYLISKSVRKYGRAKIFRLSYLAIAGSGLIFLGYNFFGIGPFAVQLQQITLRVRMYLWQTGLIMWWHHPITGVGVANYADNFRKNESAATLRALGPYLISDNAHNSFIQIGATLGVIGVIAIFLPQLRSLLIALKILRRENQSEAVVLTGIIFLAAFIGSLFSIDNIGIAIWIWALAGYFLSQKNLNNKPRRFILRFSMLVATVALLATSFIVFQPSRAVFQAELIPASSDTSPGYLDRLSIYNSLLPKRYLQEGIYESIAEDEIGLGDLKNAYRTITLGLQVYPRDSNLQQLLAIDRA